MRLVHSPRYVVDLGGHVFPARKFALAADLVPLPRVEPSEPSRKELLSVHTPEWVDKVLYCKMTLEDETAMELRLTSEVSLAHRLQVAGTILATRDALLYGAGLHAGGGSHHAFAGRAEGFCVLNDLACAAKVMGLRTAIVDLDVHQGNGTASICAGDPKIFTFSMHQAGLFPKNRASSSLDIELPAGTRDATYLERLRGGLKKVKEWGPELIIYQAGVDCAAGDLLGGLALSMEGLAVRDKLVKELGIPAAVTLGGGYMEDVGRTAELHAQTLRIFAGLSA
jgi:acetoin utilization deacetylase AcuC-like enzyme